MKLYELPYVCGMYGAFTSFDKSMKKFRDATNPALDLSNQDHRKVLLDWLNSWGVRHLAKGYHHMASKELLNWGRRHIDQLPRKEVALTKLSDSALDAITEAYGNLMRRPASMRVRKSISSSVAFGATATAKVLHALRPNALLPWDDSIRRHFQCKGTPEDYRKFLRSVQEQGRLLEEEAGRLGITPGDIPAAVGRPNSSLPKLVDEYYFVTITKMCGPPTKEELERWAYWARGDAR